MYVHDVLFNLIVDIALPDCTEFLHHLKISTHQK